MGSVIWNENKNAIVDYMQPYLVQKIADCTLYSQDGFEFPIHKASEQDLKKLNTLVLKSSSKHLILNLLDTKNKKLFKEKSFLNLF